MQTQVLTMTESSICTCPCHKPNARIMHVMACCVNCPNCGLNITYEAYGMHKKTCIPKPNHEEALDEIIITL